MLGLRGLICLIVDLLNRLDVKTWRRGDEFRLNECTKCMSSLLHV